MIAMADSVDLSENRQTEILLVAWTMTGAAILTVAIKLFARVRLVHVIGWDDLFIILSLVRSYRAPIVFKTTFDAYAVTRFLVSLPRRLYIMVSF